MAINFQLGKAGLTESFIEALKNAFKNTQKVRISLLKSCSRDKAEIKKFADKICSELRTGKEIFDHKLIGFTLIIKKSKKKP